MTSLIDSSDSLLCVIDAQPGFLDKLPAVEAEETAERVRWLVQVAAALGVPVVVTEEEPARNGKTVQAILDAVPVGTPRFDKRVFGLADQADIFDSVSELDRRTAVLCGLETDVCVAHSALGLLDRGFRVVVAADAVASPGTGQEFGLSRLRDAGVTLIGVKGLAYEWLRTVARTDALDEILGAGHHPGSSSRARKCAQAVTDLADSDTLTE